MKTKALSSTGLGGSRRNPRFHLSFPSAVPALKANGYALLPGLTHWFDKLNPLHHPEAWTALRDGKVASFIHAHSEQQAQYCLNDFGEIEIDRKSSVGFAEKRGKTHLTVGESATRIACDPRLPSATQLYLNNCIEFLNGVRNYLHEILPPPSLKTSLTMRVFHYSAATESTGGKQAAESMRPHVDGSICTLIIAQSDGLLEFESDGQWQSAIENDGHPFSLLIPGIAAAHDLCVEPTPHQVLRGPQSRISITAFLKPKLGSDRRRAQRTLARWRLDKRYH